MKIKRTEDYVIEVLKRNPKARSDDFRLYGGVLKDLGIDLKSTSLYDFLLDAKQNDYPSFESVTRARRKIFENYPELQPIQTKLNREEKEREIINYSRS